MTDTEAVVVEHARLVMELHRRGLTDEQISATLGLSLSLVRDVLERRRR